MKFDFVKRFFLVMISVCMGVTAQAAEDVPLGQRVITALPELSSQEISIEAEVTATADVQGAAPPLTYISVIAVGSSKCNWEITTDLIATKCDHGGPQLRTAVLEIGYGRSPIVWMNGSILPSTAQYARTAVCITGNKYTWPCRPGQMVYGWLNEYNLDGHQLGIFRYQNTSINAPWNTISTMISIQ